MFDSVSELERETIPATYAGAWVSLLGGRGVARDLVLANTDVAPATLEDPKARISLLEMARIIWNGLEQVDDPTLALELGLAMKPTAHGTLGYALLTCASLGDAIRLGERFLRLRIRALGLRFFLEGDQAVLEFHEVIPFEGFRDFVFEWLVGAILRIGEFLIGDRLHLDAIEVRVEMPRPAHFDRIASRVPRFRFDEPVNQARIPAAWLEYPLALSDPAAARAALTELERELLLFGEDRVDVVANVRALFEDPAFGYGDLEAAAKRLRVSSRTLRRHLKQDGTSYQELLADARKSRATAMLRESDASIEQIASVLGYADPANFARAFQKWVGKSPTAWRRG